MASLEPFPKPLMMLKDYLREDLSSCSSNGFRSYPRRQCCTTTVRFILEIDLATTKQSYDISSRRSKASPSATMSALHRASEVVINAVKHLPFVGVVSPSAASLRRRLSRKLLKRSFWKKTDREEEIKRRKSHRAVVENKPEPSDLSPTAAVTTTDSNSSTSENNSKINSWSDSGFTASDYLQCSRGNYEVNSRGNDVVVECKKCLQEKVVSERVGVGSTEATTSDAPNYSGESAKKEWLKEEDKEQFSPVSVLEFPFDDDEEVSSPFQCSLIHMEGTKQKFMQKIRRFESLAEVEPLDLEKRIALSIEEEGKTEQNAVELLKQMKATATIASFKADNLLLDFFRERNGFDYEVLDMAKDWINGYPIESLLEWEVEKKRQAYIREMENGRQWAKLDEEKKEVALEMEAEVFTTLVNEMFLDLINS